MNFLQMEQSLTEKNLFLGIQKYEPYELNDGDEIQVGDTNFTIQEGLQKLIL